MRLLLLLALFGCVSPQERRRRQEGVAQRARHRLETDPGRMLKRIERLERLLPALELTPIKVKRVNGTDHVVWVLLEDEE